MLISIFSANYSAAQRYGNTPSDSVYCVRMLSIFTEYIKQKNLSYAYQPWTILFKKYPFCSQTIYQHGVNIVKYKIQQCQSEYEKQRWIDTLMMVYDNRIKYFAPTSKLYGVGYVLGRKGTDMMKYRPENYEKAFKILIMSVDERKEKSEYGVLDVTIYTAKIMLNEGKLKRSVYNDIINNISTILEKQLMLVLSKYGTGELSYNEMSEQLSWIYNKKYECMKLIDEKDDFLKLTDVTDDFLKLFDDLILKKIKMDNDDSQQSSEINNLDPETEAKIRQQIKAKLNEQK